MFDLTVYYGFDFILSGNAFETKGLRFIAHMLFEHQKLLSFFFFLTDVPIIPINDINQSSRNFFYLAQNCTVSLSENFERELEQTKNFINLSIQD